TTDRARALIDLGRQPEAERDDPVASERLDSVIQAGQQLCLRLERRGCLAVALHRARTIDEARENLRSAEIDPDDATAHNLRSGAGRAGTSALCSPPSSLRLMRRIT